jgi:hypothetical protein
MGTRTPNEPDPSADQREEKPKPADEVGEAARAAAPDTQAQGEDYGGTGLYSHEAS